MHTFENNRFAYPTTGIAGQLINRIVSCATLLRLRRAVFSRLPFLQLASDVKNVVYCTWVVDAARAAHLVPQGVTLKQRHGKTLFTILTYSHAHFGPRIAGPLRKIFPSPKQSNWRLYVDTFPNAPDSSPAVLFIKNIFDDPLYGIGSRMFSDALPSHVAARFEHTLDGGVYRTVIAGGEGSAPAFQCEAKPAQNQGLPPEFKPFFDSWSEAVAALCLQDGAISAVEDCAGIAYARIDLPIDVGAVQPLEATDAYDISAPFLERMGVAGRPFCFVVPAVPFGVLSECLV